ncbi:MAG: phosphatase PAP2 family protein [Verrucomicrobiota bacterium]
MTPQQGDGLADAVNPVLLCVFVACSFVRFPNRQRATAFLSRSAMALLMTYFFAHIKQWLHLRENPGDFPSGHMTFLLTVATCFFLLDRRSALITIPSAFFYGWLIIFLGYHTLGDLPGALLLAVPVTLICHKLPTNSGRTDQGSCKPQ